MPGKLTYFPLGIRGELIRAICFKAGHDFEDQTLTQEEFGKMKAEGKFPLGSLPTWDEDGIQYCQSNAILRMLGIHFGFYTDDATIAWEIDSLVDYMEENVNDYFGRCVKTIFGGEVEESDDAKFLAYFDKMIPFLEGRLMGHSTKKYIAGTDTLTIADLKVYQTFIMLTHIEANPVSQELKDQVKAKIAEKAKLSAYLTMLAEDMKPWLEARQPYPV